ncbi:ATP-binding protein [Marinicella sp. W31]|uniref:ATP-binding protein n=1 Tax=Marinicella sp. W31 TaxID=3023713 RepID=UPI003756432A
MTKSDLELMKQVIVFFLCWATTLTLQANESSVLDGVWKFHWGDEPNWSEVEINESDWHILNNTLSVRQQHAHPTTGWYRLRFDAFVDTNEPQALMIEHLRHADEVWVNGLRVGGEGQFLAPWQWGKTNPQKLLRVYTLPPGFLQPNDNVLAIKVTTGFGNAWGAQFPGGAGLMKGSVSLGEPHLLQPLYQKHIVKSSAIDAVLFAFGLAHVLFVLFLLRNNLNQFIEFKWLLASSLCFLVYSFAQDFFYINAFHGVPAGMFYAASLLLSPGVIVMYFWSQYNGVHRTYIYALLLLSALSSLGLLLPVSGNYKIWCWYFWLALAIFFLIYALRLVVEAIKQKRIGAWAQCLALCVFVLSLLMDIWPELFWGHRNIHVGSLIYRYAILFAYFQKIRTMRLNYKALSSRIVNVVDDMNSKMARELHDGIGQYMASTKLQVQILRQVADNPHLAIIEEEVNNSTSGLRRLINGLHPAVVDRYDLPMLIEKECDRMMQIFPVHIDLQTETPHAIDDDNIKLNVFRIFQEAVLNAIKHGQSTDVEVYLQTSAKELVLNISDDGLGFDAGTQKKSHTEGGFGFISLHERVALLNGDIQIDSQQRQGCMMRIKLPLNAVQ